MEDFIIMVMAANYLQVYELYRDVCFTKIDGKVIKGSLNKLKRMVEGAKNFPSVYEVTYKRKYNDISEGEKITILEHYQYSDARKGSKNIEQLFNQEKDIESAIMWRVTVTKIPQSVLDIIRDMLKEDTHYSSV